MKTITITQEDHKKSTTYGDVDNCPLATALKREGYQDVCVGGTSFDVREGNDLVEYSFNPSEWGEETFIDGDIIKAKAGEFVKSTTLEFIESGRILNYYN